MVPQPFGDPWGARGWQQAATGLEAGLGMGSGLEAGLGMGSGLVSWRAPADRSLHGAVCCFPSEHRPARLCNGNHTKARSALGGMGYPRTHL